MTQRQFLTQQKDPREWKGLLVGYLKRGMAWLGALKVNSGILHSIEPHCTYLICRYWYLCHATDIVIRTSGATLEASTSEPFRPKRAIIDGWAIIDRRTIIDRWAIGRWGEHRCGWAPMKWVHIVWSPKIEALFSNYDKEKYLCYIVSLSDDCEGQIHGLLTKCEVKMAEYWPSVFFYMNMDQDRAEVHKIVGKTNKANI